MQPAGRHDVVDLALQGGAGRGGGAPEVRPAGRHDVVDLALQGGAVRVDEARSRSKVLGRLKLGDAVFRHLTRAAAFGVLIILSGVIVSLVLGPRPALR